VFDMLPLTYQFNLTQTAAAPFYQLGNVQSKALAGTFLTGAFGLLGNDSLRVLTSNTHHIEVTRCSGTRTSSGNSCRTLQRRWVM